VSATEERLPEWRKDKKREEERRASVLWQFGQDKALALTDLRRVFGKH